MGKSTNDWDDADENDVRESWQGERSDDHDFAGDTSDDFEEHTAADGEVDSDDDSDTAPCPKCGAEIYDLSDFCSVCGEAISPQQSPLPRRTLIAAGTLVLLILLATFAWKC